jgi:hypothetical protein
MIWCSPPEEQPYSSDICDPFWAAAQELEMPVSVRAITDMGMEGQYNWGERYMRATMPSHEVEKSFGVLIFSGVLDRFPGRRAHGLRRSTQSSARAGFYA